MSKHNVHPDHYKTAGRERQGKALGQDMSRKALSEQHARLAEYSSRKAGAVRPRTRA
jgi:hypothetical protein